MTKLFPMSCIETRQIDDKTIEIHYDDYNESPREWENLGTIACVESRTHELGDKTISSQDEVDEILKNVYVCLPVFCYEHSNIQLHTGEGMMDIWDTARIGIIYATKERVKEYFGRIPDKKLVEKALRQELEMYSQYVNGEVYQYQIYENGEMIDSCGGYYDVEQMVIEVTNNIRA